MSDVPAQLHHEHDHLNLIERCIFLGVCGLSMVLFWQVGWMAMEPANPRGAVSLLTRTGAVFGFVQIMGLSCVVAGVATTLLGRRLPWIGPCAAALGLCALSIRGEPANYLLIERVLIQGGSVRAFGFLLAIESVAWAIIVGATFAVSAAVDALLFDRSAQPAAPTSAIRVDSQSPLTTREAARVVGATGLITLILVFLLSSGYRSRSVQHGQAIFLASASMALAQYVVHRWQLAAPSTISILSIPLVTVIGYLIASLISGGTTRPVAVPASPFFTMLPIQWVAGATVATIVMVWSIPSVYVGTDERKSATEKR